MTQDTTIHHMITTQRTEVLQVISISKDVMVTTDQHLITIQPTDRLQRLLVDYYIAEMIDLVVWLNDRVPVGNQSLVHLISIVPRTHRLTICSGKLADVGMPEVGV